MKFQSWRISVPAVTTSPFFSASSPGGNHPPAAGRIDRDGLLDEGVLAGFDGGLQVQRPKQRRRRHQDDLRVGLHKGLIAGGAAEAPFGRDVELLCPLAAPAP